MKVHIKIEDLPNIMRMILMIWGIDFQLRVINMIKEEIENQTRIQDQNIIIQTKIKKDTEKMNNHKEESQI